MSDAITTELGASDHPEWIEVRATGLPPTFDKNDMMTTLCSLIDVNSVKLAWRPQVRELKGRNGFSGRLILNMVGVQVRALEAKTRGGVEIKWCVGLDGPKRSKTIFFERRIHDDELAVPTTVPPQTVAKVKSFLAVYRW